jgi:hypothetical protein
MIYIRKILQFFCFNTELPCLGKLNPLFSCIRSRHLTDGKCSLHSVDNSWFYRILNKIKNCWRVRRFIFEALIGRF